jgi:hypothetical protein
VDEAFGEGRRKSPSDPGGAAVAGAAAARAAKMRGELRMKVTAAWFAAVNRH